MAVDYTTEADPYDLEIAADFMADKDAEQIEQENSFREIPPGEHLLRVIGVSGLKRDEPIHQEFFEVYVEGKKASYDAHKLNVRFCLADDSGAQITDMFVVPPGNPKQREAYLHGSKNPDGKGAGFWANKFTHYIQRLGWSFGAGEPIPAEACRTANWKGKLVMATVIAGTPYEDKQTREMKDGRAQIKSFSYRAVGDNAEPQPSARPATRPSPAPAPAAKPRPAANPATVPKGLSSL